MASDSTPEFIDYDKIFLFGDSITQGACDQASGFALAAALEHDYIRRLDVLNRGFSGYNSSHALYLLPSIIPPPIQSKIKLMTIFFGANDAVLEGQPQHVPLEEYRINLQRIVAHPLVIAHDPKILLITPPPVCEYKTQAHDREMGRTQISRLAEITRTYADAAIQVGQEMGIPVVNLWGAFMACTDWSGGSPLPGSKSQPQNEKLGELLRDGLHLTPKGYEIMYRETTKAIHDYYPELKPYNLPFIFPVWEHAPRYEE